MTSSDSDERTSTKMEKGNKMEIKEIVLEEQPAEKPGVLEGLDLEDLRITQDQEDISIKPVLNLVPVRKPHKQEFFRTQTGDEWVFLTRILELKDDRETYLVHPSLLLDLELELKPVALYTCYNRQGNYFLVPVMLPKDGKQNSWHESLQQAINEGKHAWVRAVPDQTLGGYNIVVATGNLKEPRLAAVSGIKQLIQIAFRNRFIDSIDHPVIKRLWGES